MALLGAGAVVLIGTHENRDVSASHQFLTFEKNSDSFAEFGPNEAVVIDGTIEFLKGCSTGTDDFFYPVADVYVVPTGVSGPGLSDVSGTPNTVIGVGGGAFVSEVIAYTAPGGNLGSGTYAIVFDECQNGVLDAGDFVLDPAFSVTLPVNVPLLPSASILAAKGRAGELKDHWDNAHMAYKWLFKLSDSVKGPAKKDIADKIKDFAEKLASNLGGADIKKAALTTILAMRDHYKGIEADPPDLNYQQLVTLGPREPLELPSNDPLAEAGILAGEAAENEAAIAEALLTAMERYQGAGLEGNGEWALAHARAIRQYSLLLADQLAVTNAVLGATDAALTADTRDLDGAAADFEAIRTSLLSSGFGPDELRLMENLGLSDSDVAEIFDGIVADDFSGFSGAAVHGILADHQAANTAAAADLMQLAADLDAIIAALEANPDVFDDAPQADAGGPYSGVQGTLISFDGSGSISSSAITAYEWDLDGDGEFDDATGATPSHTFDRAFNGLVGLRVSNDAGFADVDYAPVEVVSANARPVFDALSPVAFSVDIEVGGSLTFSATVSDPDGDGVGVEWFIDEIPVATGASFTYSPSTGDEGLHSLDVVATDDSPFVASSHDRWNLSVFPLDADGDSWNVNSDCDDGDPAVNPGASEVVGNGIDDDCDAATPDEGSPPVPDFATDPVIAGIGDTVQFADTSADPDGDIVSWSWDFGNDGSVDSTAQNPTNTYSTGGSFDVALEVTDGQGHTASVVKSVPVVDPSILIEGPATGTQYVSFWSGDLRIFAQRDNTEILLIDVDTGAPLSMVDPRISSKNFSTNPFTLASAGDSFEGVGGLGNATQEIRVRIIASDATSGTEIKPITVWTGSLTSSTRHPASPPGAGNPWASYIPAFSETAASNGRELGRDFLGFTTREMYIIAKKGSSPTSILVEDLATNTDTDTDDTVTLTSASASKTYEDAAIQVFFLDAFEDDTVRVTSNVDASVVVGRSPANAPDWTTTPPSYAAGDEGIELGTLFYTFARRSLTVFPTQDNTTVTITDLSDGDDSKTMVLANGDTTGDYDLYTPIIDSVSDGNIIPRSSSPAVTVVSNSENPFDNDLVKVEADKPVLVYVGPVGSNVNEFADVAFSVATGPESRIIYTYAQNFGNSNDLQIFGFDPDTEVTITSLSFTAGFRNNGQHDFTIGPGIGGTNGWLEGTTGGDVWWGSGVWNGEMLRIESTKPITVINGDYDAAHFGAFIPFVQSTPLLPPVADAGADQAIPLGDAAVIDGSGSFDQDAIAIGLPIKYEWDFDTSVDSDDDGDPANDVDATGVSPAHTYAAAGTYTVQLTFTDDDGQSDTDEALVTILPLPPVAVAGGPYVTDEGGLVVLDGSASFDVDGTIVLYEWDLDNDGQFDDAAGENADLFLADDALLTVGLRVTDDDGLSGEANASVTALNLAPVVNAGPDASVNSTFSLPPSWFSDAGVPDTHTAIVDWGDGTVEGGTVGQSPGSGTIAGTHTYTSNGTYVVEVCVTDDDSGVSCDQLSVLANVTNEPPVVEPEVGHTFNEGDSHVHEFAYTDLNSDDIHTASVDWGDGSPPQVVSILNDLSGFGVAFPSHTYGDNGDFTVQITVCDVAVCEARSFVEHVGNLPPSVDAGPDQTVEKGGAVTLAPATFTDPGADDTHIATIDWGDGSAVESGAVSEAGGTGTVAGSHSYSSAGAQTAEVCVTDDDGASHCDAFQVLVLEPPDLRVQKFWQGLDPLTAPAVTVTVTGPEFPSGTSCTPDLIDGGGAVLQAGDCDFDDIDPGAYDVVESLSGALILLVGYDPDEDANAANGGQVVLSYGDDTTMKITNADVTGGGCSHGFWKTHSGIGPGNQPNQWPATRSPADLLGDTFGLGSLADLDGDGLQDSLWDALSYGGGGGHEGAARILLRQAVAALLNAEHPDVGYPRASADVIIAVNDALANGKRHDILQLAGELDFDNNLGCTIVKGVGL